MTESGERERALKLYEELDGIAREFDNYDFGLSYSDEPRDKSLAIITQFERAAIEAGRVSERNIREDRREKLAYVRHLFDLLQEVAEQHFKLGGTHADKGALNCDCVLAKSHQKTRAEWFTCSEALRRPAPPDSGDKKGTGDAG